MGSMDNTETFNNLTDKCDFGEKIRFSEDYEQHYKVLSVASHEIMNYLSTIGSTYQYLDTRYPETQGFKFWGNLGTSVKYLCYFMKQTSVCRYGHFPHRTNTTPQAVIELVYETLGECQYQDIIEHIYVNTDNPDAELYCDPDNIAAATYQLIVNAYEATENSDAKDITVDITTSPDTLTIRVTNSGELDGEHTPDELVQPFFTTRDKHAGCGLYIANIVCTAHGGYLTIDSKDGITAVTLTVNCAQSELKSES